MTQFKTYLFKEGLDSLENNERVNQSIYQPTTHSPKQA
jgi:hypothetical protein